MIALGVSSGPSPVPPHWQTAVSDLRALIRGSVFFRHDSERERFSCTIGVGFPTIEGCE
ncbi:unnamed protein product [Linum tenue]|uniref:Uncharacterized protein n=1 Tax=Linum tenue TaxID=586396 RepID=A0AAV0GXZ3_9ROSI|nr:unnamed protein product [Linum tenue]